MKIRVAYFCVAMQVNYRAPRRRHVPAIAENLQIVHDDVAGAKIKESRIGVLIGTARRAAGCYRIVSVKLRPLPGASRKPCLIHANIYAGRCVDWPRGCIEVTTCRGSCGRPIPARSTGLRASADKWRQGAISPVPSVPASQDELITRLRGSRSTYARAAAHSRSMQPRATLGGSAVRIAAVRGNVIGCGEGASTAEEDKDECNERWGKKASHWAPMSESEAVL